MLSHVSLRPRSLRTRMPNAGVVRSRSPGEPGILGGGGTPEIRAHLSPLLFEHINFPRVLPVQSP